MSRDEMLLPCPFCGKPPVWARSSGIFCVTEDCPIDGVHCMDPKVWNTRPSASLLDGSGQTKSADGSHSNEQSGKQLSPAWQSGAINPPVERGREREFIVAVFRKNSGKTYTFAATYLNAYPLNYEYECPKGDGCSGDGCNDGCPTTGWFYLTGEDGEAGSYNSLSIGDGDILKGWRELPQWDDAETDASNRSKSTPPAVFADPQNSPPESGER